MGIKKPTITTAGLSHELARALEPVKQSIEMLTGARRGMPEIAGLPDGAKLEAVVQKLNEVIARLNASGEVNGRQG